MMQASIHYNTPSLAYLKPFCCLYFKFKFYSRVYNHSWGNSQIQCPCLSAAEYALVKNSLALLETVTKGSGVCRSWLCCLLYIQVDSWCHIDYYWWLQAEGEETFQISAQSEDWFRLNGGRGLEYHHGDGGEAAGRPSLLRFWEVFPYQHAGAWPPHELLTSEPCAHHTTGQFGLSCIFRFI